jgi:biopolymer transport protein ExbD
MKRFETINVIPFIDIMLVLLAIVLTTATFIVEGKLDIRLPESQAQVRAEAQLEQRELAIGEDGSLYVDSAPVELSVLGDLLDALDENTPVILRVDAGVRFSRFVQVVDLLKAANLKRLTILTRQADGKT